jgi:hypothetical protein
MKKLSFTIILVALAALTYSFIPPPATPVHVDFPYSDFQVFTNPCTGEDVDLTYEGEINIRGVINNNRVNINLHANIHLDGVGQTSGDTYVGHISQKETLNGSLNNGQFVGSVVANANLNTSGGGNNVKETITFHVTVNANGDVTVVRAADSQVCQ